MRTQSIGPDRKLAERTRQRREQELNDGTLQAVHRISYDEFKREELEMMRDRMAAKSLSDLDYTLQTLDEACNVMTLSAVTPRMVEKYLSWRLQTASKATANKALRTLKASLNRATRRGYLRSNPAAEIKQLRVPETEKRVLSEQEIAQLFSACPSIRWKALVALAVTTGMRLGEMLALCREDVDFETHIVRIQNRPGHLTKSRKNRVLALPPTVAKLLRRILPKGKYVFQTLDGRQWHNNLHRDFQQIVRRAGIKRCTLHDLRRTFVSHLAMAGVNEAVVQELAGHASITTTLKYYTGIMPEALRAAQARLPFAHIFEDVSYPYHEPISGAGGKMGRVIKLGQATA